MKAALSVCHACTAPTVVSQAIPLKARKGNSRFLSEFNLVFSETLLVETQMEEI